ncbi:hypothetical protein ACWT_5145 [Actinoplanes sp. SE50]|uniref:hypothetical protein n=1 Tax=unclassified Actinoplanes TaxID=2626549 RepID=UPI00023ED493|nr:MULTISPECIES: hypothetical protein [unclassified Actinoplanes]AEV86162.1 hypothetical protein ACPL_5275 [Actinoplanes sp. SE50/110]ATO84560.1 hypothetical protein ACWT_5145 [Actinoplanes sp. SE50]SLM01970.1 uncharacterized protein ACSP50_5208 [Actinoplanes sp. SE50/110]
MSDQNAELDAALERVVEAARAHLAAVKAAAGRIDDDDVWQAYVDLNNASFAYDEKLLDAFGEVTPWDVESIDPDEADQRFLAGEAGADGGAGDAYPQVISVRQRRDYRVPSVSALLRVAENARKNAVPEDEEVGPVESVGEAVLELLQAGDGSLASLDVPELEPLDGLLTVTEVEAPLDLEAFDDADGSGPFAPAEGDQLVGRLDEHPFLPDEEDDHAGHNH